MSDLDRTMVELVRPGLAVTHLAMVERNQRIIDATDADRECEHGKLPGDRVQECDCWILDGEAA